jgi:hypothetical protein
VDEAFSHDTIGVGTTILRGLKRHSVNIHITIRQIGKGKEISGNNRRPKRAFSTPKIPF